jgi:hypothetical protein
MYDFITAAPYYNCYLYSLSPRNIATSYIFENIFFNTSQGINTREVKLRPTEHNSKTPHKHSHSKRFCMAAQKKRRDYILQQ